MALLWIVPKAIDVYGVPQCEAIDIFGVPNSEAIDTKYVPSLEPTFELQKYFSGCFKSQMNIWHFYSTQGVQMLHISKNFIKWVSPFKDW